MRLKITPHLIGFPVPDVETWFLEELESLGIPFMLEKENSHFKILKKIPSEQVSYIFISVPLVVSYHYFFNGQSITTGSPYDSK